MGSQNELKSGVVRGDDDDAPAIGEQAVKFFHGADDVANMLNDVHGANLSEAAVGKGERELVEIGNDVGAGFRIAIEADGAGIFVNAAANVRTGSCCAAGDEVAADH